MFPFAALFPLMFKSILSLLSSGLFWIIVLVVGIQYGRMGRSTQELMHLPLEPVWRVTLLATVFGLGGGILGSFLLILVGISVQEIGINYLWITALIMMFIQQRFLCFAYAGGVLALSRLLLGFPEISVPQLMGLVAILHAVEALLILFSGHLHPLPMYIRTKEGRVVGGYNLQKFWPLPLVALVAWTLPGQEIVQSGIQMPEWWPLIKPEFLTGEGEIMYMMMPVVAALGYGDIAVTEYPRTKTRRAAAELALYSIILLLLAIGASFRPEISFLPALFGPLGHELLIKLGQKRELRGVPIFVPPEQGIMILHVVPDSPLSKAGVRDGDILLAVDGYPVSEESRLQSLLLGGDTWLEIDYLEGEKRNRKKARVFHEIGEPLGMVPVPRWYEGRYVEVSGSLSLLERWYKRFFRRDK